MNMNTESKIAVVESRARRESLPVPAVDATPMSMLAVAVQRGDDLQKLEKLMDLQERWERNEARKAYIVAMAEFKKNPPAIIKDKHVKFQTARGVTEYDHATLFAVCDAAIAGLSKVDITHRWVTEQGNGLITVTCILTHVAGHSENNTLSGAPDESGGKNSIQAIASTVSYLQRYTLLAVSGLATKDQDNDGRGAVEKPAEPDGYDSWKADMLALADEGLERLQKSWSESKPEFRRYVVKHDEAWWLESKAKAAKVAS